MSEIVEVSITSITPSPFRLLGEYPYITRKIEALKRSIEDVGLWEGVIARRKGKQYELAFGHHRIEAARQAGLKKVPLVVRELDDEQMLQFMGRENLEDYNADFLVMLETWESASAFARRGAQKLEPVEIARLLGWTRDNKGVSTRMNETAQACASTSAMIEAKYIKRDDLKELSVKSVRELCGRAQTRIEQIEKVGSANQRPRADIDKAKAHVGKAAVQTAKDVRRGEVAAKDVGGRVEVHAFKYGKPAKDSPMFAVFGRTIALNIGKMLDEDASAEKIREILKSLNKVTMDEDKAAIRMIDFALAELEERCGMWRRKLAGGAKVTPLKLLKKES